MTKLITTLQFRNALNKLKQTISDVVTATSKDIETTNIEINNINTRLDQLDVNGVDGFSPIISVETVDGGHKIIITDATHTEEFIVLDGKSDSNTDNNTEMDDVKIVTWADGTDEEIAAMVNAHYAGKINLHDYWNVGDERKVQLSAMEAKYVGENHEEQEVTLVLMNKGGKELFLPINGINECAFVVGQKNALIKIGCIEPSSTLGGWDSCARRKWCNEIYRQALPTVLSSIFKQHKNITADDESNESYKISIDYFSLPSEIEVHGTRVYSAAIPEQQNKQFAYYEISSKKVKRYGDNGTTCTWWTRSLRSYRNDCYVYMSSSGYPLDIYNAQTNNNAIAPFGCI